MARRLGHAENPRVARHMEKLPLVSHDQGRLGSRRQGWQVRRCRRRSADLLVQQLRSAKMAHLRGGSRRRHAVGQDGIAFRIPGHGMGLPVQRFAIRKRQVQSEGRSRHAERRRLVGHRRQQLMGRREEDPCRVPAAARGLCPPGLSPNEQRRIRMDSRPKQR